MENFSSRTSINHELLSFNSFGGIESHTMPTLSTKAKLLILGLLGIRVLYTVSVVTSNIRSEYTGALELGIINIFLVLLAIFALLKRKRVPLFVFGCLMATDLIKTVSDLWKFTTFSGVAQEDWNPLTKSVLTHDALPLLIFWALLFAIFVYARKSMRLVESV